MSPPRPAARPGPSCVKQSPDDGRGTVGNGRLCADCRVLRLGTVRLRAVPARDSCRPWFVLRPWRHDRGRFVSGLLHRHHLVGRPDRAFRSENRRGPRRGRGHARACGDFLVVERGHTRGGGSIRRSQHRSGVTADGGCRRHDDRTVPPRRTNTLINAGTSVGVAICGPIALFFGADWRAVYMLFCGLALVTTVAVLLAVPGSSPGRATARATLPRFSTQLRKLISAAFLTGTISTTVWSFGGELTARALTWTSGDIGILWIVIGIAGGGGAFAGRLVARFGINPVHKTALVGLIFGVLCVGHPHTTATLALLGAALFGASYIMLTGVYLVWGTAVLPERPATGLTIAFLAIAVGQTVGAPVFAWLLEATSPLSAVLVFAALGVVPAAIGYGPGW